MITTYKNKFNLKTKEEKQEEINSIFKSLEDGVRDVFDSEKYKRYLEFCGKFHHYSFNNVILILMQCPHAHRCASYTTWKSLNMHVRKGEKGIKILCPVPYSYIKKDSSDEEDENGSTYLLVSGIRFKIGHVFDISQVDGEMPTFANELMDNSEHIHHLIEKLIDSSPISIIYDYSLTKEQGNGYYDLDTNTIALRAGMGSHQTFKTLIHEIAHSILHNDNKCSNREAEVQAESTAYVVFFDKDNNLYVKESGKEKEFVASGIEARYVLLKGDSGIIFQNSDYDLYQKVWGQEKEKISSNVDIYTAYIDFL
jgi:antirestriction protein ArdC